MISKQKKNFFSGPHSLPNARQPRALGNDGEDPGPADALSYGQEDEDETLSGVKN